MDQNATNLMGPQAERQNDHKLLNFDIFHVKYDVYMCYLDKICDIIYIHDPYLDN